MLKFFVNLRSKKRTILCVVWIMKTTRNLFLNYCIIQHLSRNFEIFQRFCYLIIIFLNFLKDSLQLLEF